MSIIQEIKNSFKQGSIVTQLIYVNVALFLAVHLVETLGFLVGRNFSLVSFLALPANLHQLLLRPWSIISYMFLHRGLLHLLFNMLWLYWLGQLFLRYFNRNQLLGLYLMGGLMGAAVYLLLYNASPVFDKQLPLVQLLGASGAVLAILAAVASYAPNHPIRLFFIGEIKLKYFALTSLLLYVIGMAGSNAGGDMAHVGGMLCGLLFIVAYRRGRDLTRWVPSLCYHVEQLFKPRSRVKVSYRNTSKQQREKSQQQKKTTDAKQEKLNQILQKVRQSGYSSLTAEEKQLLFKQ